MVTFNANKIPTRFTSVAYKMVDTKGIEYWGQYVVGIVKGFSQTQINPNLNFYAKTLRLLGHTHGMLAGEATNWRSPRFSY